MPTIQFDWPAFRAFLFTVIDQHNSAFKEQEFIAISLPIYKQTNDELTARLSTSNPSFYLSHPTSEFVIVGQGVLERVTTSGINRFHTTSALGKNLFNRIHHFNSLSKPYPLQLLGGFSFFNTLNKDSEWSDFEPSLFHLPEWTLLQNEDEATLSLIEPIQACETIDKIVHKFQEKLYSWIKCAHNQSSDKNGDAESRANQWSIPTPSEINDSVHSNPPTSGEVTENFRAFNDWNSMITKAKKTIKEKNLKKVVLARKVTQSFPIMPEAKDVISNLERQYPDCFIFCINPKGKSYFVGATPERLARFTPTQVVTESLAGSTMRGKTFEEDDRLAGKLLSSKKDRLEHKIVVEAIEEDLVPYSERMEHSSSPQVKKLPNVQHLYTPISAVFKKGISRTNVLKDLHPTPAVGGFPREKALEFIESEESFSRGWYASPIGWINSHGIGDFYVAIRSGLIEQNTAHIYAGCGIVEDSDPKNEWVETELKFKPMVEAVRMATNVYEAATTREQYAKHPII